MSLFWLFANQLASIETMQSASKKMITREEWEKKLNDVKIRKEDMNQLVMNFLVTEGFVDAAEKFRMESGTEPHMDLATIADRMAVKKAVQYGDVDDAIAKVNDLNPEQSISKFSIIAAVVEDQITIVGRHALLNILQGFLCLLNIGRVALAKLQRFIELIRNGKTEEALEFAQEELAPRGEENQHFLKELERTVTLLAFENVSNCPSGELLDISQRLKTANEVNAVILSSQNHEKDPKLPNLLKMLIWAQTELGRKVTYPRMIDLSTAVLEDPAIRKT